MSKETQVCQKRPTKETYKKSPSKKNMQQRPAYLNVNGNKGTKYVYT